MSNIDEFDTRDKTYLLATTSESSTCSFWQCYESHLSFIRIILFISIIIIWSLIIMYVLSSFGFKIKLVDPNETA